MEHWRRMRPTDPRKGVSSSWDDMTIPKEKLIILGKMILSGDLESMRQGLDIGDSASIIDIHKWEDEETKQYNDENLDFVPPEWMHRHLDIEFTTSQNFFDLLRDMYADIPGRETQKVFDFSKATLTREEQWVDSLEDWTSDIQFLWDEDENAVKIMISVNEFDRSSKKWKNRGHFKTY